MDAPLPHRFVTLTMSATVNGLDVTVATQVRSDHWDQICAHSDARAESERHLRQLLGDAIVERLAPPVTLCVDPEPGGELAQRTWPGLAGDVSGSN
ncbi:hypothetical protein [Streptomyces zaomyceticus]|uniref:hypothetical protein n=1 Tax=Streptomyces zaomyceticus TaxID=68286 RepID=UPI002E1EBD4E